MEKKYLLGFLVVLFLLASCSQGVKDSSLNVSDDNDSLADSVNKSVVNQTIDSNATDVVVVYSSDLLIKKRIGSYEFDKAFSVKNENLNSFKFNGFQAQYSFEGTNALVSILFLAGDSKVVNLYEFLNKSIKDGGAVFLDAEDFDYLSDDLYFDPYKNTYFWLSKDKIIMVKHSVGFDILNKYLDSYPPSVVKGSYEDQEVALQFEGKNDEKMIFLNKNQYIIKLVDLEMSSGEVTFSINGERSAFEEGDLSVLGGLLVRVSSVDFDAKKVKILVLREIFESKSYVMDVGDSVEFKMSGKNVVLKLTGANSNAMSVIVNLNGKVSSIGQKQTKSIGDFDVRIDDLFINTIGEEMVKARIIVWPSK
ncbi:MAG: hypothetical protein KJ583_04380 [Nanoarchaeota archaeon]|nr:hypothetical protein [Nanoarchaeota archaeon]MBU1270303.1 hypothetical protein [Nanoarchaeota archaeon]MBU1604529.1 hypothetical protein [Nanoarchaeota archaeon]MBU2442864.1 hypothetical protein [Nanoarchaeota archaeon]